MIFKGGQENFISVSSGVLPHEHRALRFEVFKDFGPVGIVDCCRRHSCGVPFEINYVQEVFSSVSDLVDVLNFLPDPFKACSLLNDSHVVIFVAASRCYCKEVVKLSPSVGELCCVVFTFMSKEPLFIHLGCCPVVVGTCRSEEFEAFILVEVV